MDESPHSLVVPQTSCEVNGVVKGRERMDIGWVAREDVEEMEGFQGMVPEAFYDLVD